MRRTRSTARRGKEVRCKAGWIRIVRKGYREKCWLGKSMEKSSKQSGWLGKISGGGDWMKVVWEGKESMFVRIELVLSVKERGLGA